MLAISLVVVQLTLDQRRLILARTPRYDRSTNHLPILEDRVEEKIRKLKECHGGILYFYSASIAWTLPILKRYRLVSRVQQNKVQLLLESSSSSVVFKNWDEAERAVTSLLKA